MPSPIEIWRDFITLYTTYNGLTISWSRWGPVTIFTWRKANFCAFIICLTVTVAIGVHVWVGTWILIFRLTSVEVAVYYKVYLVILAQLRCLIVCLLWIHPVDQLLSFIGNLRLSTALVVVERICHSCTVIARWLVKVLGSTSFLA